MGTGRLRWFPNSLTALAVVVMTGCVASADKPSPTDPVEVTITTVPLITTTMSLEDVLSNYRNCVSDLGVSIDEITLDGKGRPRMAMAMAGLDFSDSDTLEALEVCSPVLSGGALDLSADPALRDLVQAQLEDFAECMRRNGAEFPDPVTDFTGVGAPFPVDDIPWTDPDLATAAELCSTQLRARSAG